MTIKIFSFVIFVIILFNYGCGFGNCTENHFSFIHPIRFSPSSKDLFLGDTLWITSEFSCEKMLNIEVGDTVSFCNIEDPHCTLVINQLNPDSSSSPFGAVDKFTIVNTLTGIAVYKPEIIPNKIIRVDFGKTSNTYRFKFGLVPKITGSFCIGIPASNDITLSNNKSKCTSKGSFDFLITNSDPHKELLYDFWQVDYPEPGIENDNSYCFNIFE